MNVHPAFAGFALDVAAPDVLAVAALNLLHGEGVVGPAAAHGLAAVVGGGGGVALPAERSRRALETTNAYGVVTDTTNTYIDAVDSTNAYIDASDTTNA